MLAKEHKRSGNIPNRHNKSRYINLLIFGPGDSADALKFLAELIAKRRNWKYPWGEKSALEADFLRGLERSGNIPNEHNKSRYINLLIFGPGGIRTHDQRIMSPLRYRCATGPWRLSYSILLSTGLR